MKKENRRDPALNGSPHLVEDIMDGQTIPIFSDQRGMAVFFKDCNVNELHIVTMNPGTERGNHLHDRDEIMCILGGECICEITLSNEFTHETQTVRVTEDVSSYKIKAGLKHTVRNKGGRVLYLICFLDGKAET